MVAQHFPQLAAPWVYKRLTRWYIFRVLLHGRDQYGSIKMPLSAEPDVPVAKTYQEEKSILDTLRQMAADGLKVSGLDKADEDLAKKYGR